MLTSVLTEGFDLSFYFNLSNHRELWGFPKPFGALRATFGLALGRSQTISGLGLPTIDFLCWGFWIFCNSGAVWACFRFGGFYGFCAGPDHSGGFLGLSTPLLPFLGCWAVLRLSHLWVVCFWAARCLFRPFHGLVQSTTLRRQKPWANELAHPIAKSTRFLFGIRV